MFVKKKKILEIDIQFFVQIVSTIYEQKIVSSIYEHHVTV